NHTVLEFLRGRGIAPATAAISLGESDIMHGLRSVKVNPLPVDTWKRLPALLAKPVAIYWDKQNPGLVYVLEAPKGQGKVIVLVDYKTRVNRTQTRVNTVRTGRLVDSLKEFDNAGRYTKVR
ncbi:MAG: hypothetical protein RRY29_07705, partial [Desulfovibrionaceae bacterium]